VSHTTLSFFVCFLKQRELRNRRFRNILGNPTSYVSTVDFPHNPDFL